MSIQDEQNKKIIAISMKSAEVTLKSILKTLKFICTNLPKIKNLKTEQSLETLVKNNNSISKIDIEDIDLTNKDLKLFKKIAKDCGLKYSLVQNKENGKVTFFFNAGKSEVYEHTYNKLREVLERKNDIQQNLSEKIKEKQNIIKNNMKKQQKKQKSNKR